MKKNNKTPILVWVAVFISFCLISWTTFRYAASYIEQMQTLFFNAGFIWDTLSRAGGPAILLSLAVTQFFVSPVLSTIVNALVFTALSYLAAEIFRKLSGGGISIIPGIIAVLGFLSQSYDINFHYVGIISVLLMEVALFGYVAINNRNARLIIGIVCTPVLFFLAGPVAMLFAVSALTVEIFRSPRRSLPFLVLPLLAFLAGLMAVRYGLLGEMRHAIAPYGYYTHRLRIPPVAFAGWGFWYLALIVCLVSGLFCKDGRKSRTIYSVAEFVLAMAIGFCAAGMVNRSDLFFRELYVKAGDQDWKGIIRSCEKHKANNLLFQNYLSIALAETGKLADKALDYGIEDIRGIYVETNKTPYVSSLLSDVHYSMGELGLSQRYGFEANEAWGNYSPRMLKRLSLINLASGEYAVAEKYLRLLKQTLFHKDWAEHYSALLWNDDAVDNDPVVSMKRKCLDVDNKLSGLGGLDIDLKNIIRANPAHKATIQYLGTLYFLIGDQQKLSEMMKEFYGTEALDGPAPRLFRQAVPANAN